MGAGNFGTANTIYSTTGNSVISISSKDVDNDGDLDLVGVSSKELMWFENLDGKGTFSDAKVITTTPHIYRSVRAADVDGDNDADIVVAYVNSSSSGVAKVLIYQNSDGLGNFNTSVELDSYIQINNSFVSALSIHIFDADNDGDRDILVAIKNFLFTPVAGNDYLVWYENTDGAGTYSSQRIISTTVHEPSSLFTADIDGDNDLDILAASHGYVEWFENQNGLGNFVSRDRFDITPNNEIGTSNREAYRSSFLSDINGDGYPDIVASTRTTKNIVWFANLDGLGNFGSINTLASFGANVFSIFPADLDSDNDTDILFGTSGSNEDFVSWFENTGNSGTFDQRENIASQEFGVQSPKSVFVEDVDGDSDLDILSASWFDGKLAWYENLDGEGKYSSQHIIATNLPMASSIYATDINGDGYIDAVAASSTNNEVSWFQNLDGQGTFGSKMVISTSANQVRSVFAADIDGDGDMDVLSASPSDDKLAWYENEDGLGTFGAQKIISTSGNGVIKLHVADIDDDGDLDVLTASGLDNKIAWYENLDGNGSFSSELVITLNADLAESVYASDLDGDLDVLSASFDDDKIAWYENTDGLGNFGTEQIVSRFVDGPEIIALGDLDNDSDPDIVSTAFLGSQVTWHKNLRLFENRISGTIQLDLDGNGCNTGDLSMEGLLVKTTNSTNTFSTFTDANGNYLLYANQESFETSIASTLPDHYQSNPLSHVYDFTGQIGVNRITDFCVEPTQSVSDVTISLYPSLDDPRPGFDTSYLLVYKNNGTIQQSGDITLTFDDSIIQFLSASEVVSSQNTNSISFNYANLNPFETRSIELQFNVFPPPTTNIDDILESSVVINPIANDANVDDNTSELTQILVGSFDPNDIRVLEGDLILIEDIDEYLHYIIRFQNTGTASAINVNVETVLDDKLDWDTLQLEELSHNGRVEIKDGNQIKFIFDNIDLPSVNMNEPNSHGYIAYKIKPKSNVEVGDILTAVADIFFDFNPPITTNTASTEIETILSNEDYDHLSFKIYPNPVDNQINIQGEEMIESVFIYDVHGRQVRKKDIRDDHSNISLDVSSLSKGIYFIEIQSSTRKETQKIVKR